MSTVAAAAAAPRHMNIASITNVNAIAMAAKTAVPAAALAATRTAETPTHII